MNLIKRLGILVGTAAFLFAATSRAEQVFKSPSHQVTLVELYTSEGCSSCPPADQRMSSLVNQGGLWNIFVPVAFHVDYWNSPWADPLSSAQFTQRQGNYGRGLQTPDIVIDGERDSGYGLGQLNHGNNNQVGVLEVTSQGEKNYSVVFRPTSKTLPSVEAHVALVGLGVTYHIPSGENAGKTLVHDFAALNLAETTLQNAGGVWSGTLTLPRASLNTPDRGIAAWVTVQGHPIQATGGFLK